MRDLTSHAGGDRNRNSGKLTGPIAINTAGAPASSRRNPVVARPVGTLSVEGGSGRGPAAEWIQLIPKGVFFGRDGRGPFRLDDPERVITTTLALRMEAGIPIDYDHATEFAAPEGRPAPAAGWIREFKVRDGALLGRVDWTARAAAAIRAGEYRYISPVFQFDASDGRVTRLLRAGLTNNPNLYLTAIAAGIAAERNSSAIEVPVTAADDIGEEETMEDFLTQLREILGLGQDAPGDEVLERVRGLAHTGGDGDGGASMSAGVGDPARFVGVAEYQRVVTELNAMRAEHARERAAREVEDAIHAGKLVPALREWAFAYCAADLKGFQAFVAKQPSIVAPDPAFASGGAAASGAALTSAEVAVCAQLGLKHSDFLARKIGRRDFLSLERGSSEAGK